MNDEYAQRMVLLATTQLAVGTALASRRSRVPVTAAARRNVKVHDSSDDFFNYPPVAKRLVEIVETRRATGPEARDIPCTV